MSNVKRKFDLGWLSTYRNELFGLAAISIMIHHFVSDFLESQLYHMADPAVRILARGYYQGIGSIGVEIFLLLSGMGLFYSFCKDEKLLPFYKKRFVRVLPAYCLVGGIYFAVRNLVITKGGIKGFLGEFTFYTFWRDGDTAMWFIAAILVFYLIYPLFYKSFQGKRHKIQMLLIVLVAVLCGEILLHEAAPEFYDHTNFMLLRSVVFVIGCYLGQSIREQRKLSMSVVWICILLVFAGKIYVEYQDFEPLVWRNYNAIFSLCLTMFLCIVLHRFAHARMLRKFLRICGTYSLELYMTHVALRWIFKKAGLLTADVRIYLLVILIAVISSVMVHKVTGKISEAVIKK